MTNNELENRIANKILECFSILREFDSNCNELHMSIQKTSTNSYLIKFHNDAYKNDVSPVLVHKYFDESALNFKAVDLATRGLFCGQEILQMFDDATEEVKEATRAANALESQKNLVNITLSAARSCLDYKIYTELRGGKK